MGAGASVSQGLSNAEIRESLFEQAASTLPEGSPLMEQLRGAFSQFDANSDQFITHDEFMAAVSGMGLAWSTEDCNGVLERMDQDKDGKISFEEFVAFMQSDDSEPPPPVDQARLQQVFLEFASFGSADIVREMDGAKFSKLSRDCKLLDKKLTRTDVDLIFTKAKLKGARKMTFEQFEQTAIPLLAEKKYPDDAPAMRDAVLANLINANGPTSSGTQADSDGTLARMTDETKYTGAHRRSSTGVSSRSRRRSSIAKMVGSSSEAELAEAQVAAAEIVGGAAAGAGGPAPNAAAAAGANEAPAPLTITAANDPNGPDTQAMEEAAGAAAAATVSYDRLAVERVFLSFCSFGSQDMVREMDGAKFAKLARDCRLLDKNLTRTDVDLVFASCKPATVRKLNLQTFEAAALPALAKKKFPQMTDADATSALAMVISQCAPATSGTSVDADSTVARLSVSAPSEGGAVARRRESIARRTSNAATDDVTAAAAAAAAAATEPRQSVSAGRRSRSGSFALPTPPDMASGELPMTREDLNNVFLQFSSFGSSKVNYEMDGAKFVKLARDCGLLGKTLTNTDVDLIFTKTKEKGERKITYDRFEQVGIPLLAQKKFPQDEAFEGIKKILAKLASSAPQSSGTQADADGTVARMTDESLYPSGARRRSSVGGRRASAAGR